MLIIGISGKAEHGKTTSANILKKAIEEVYDTSKLKVGIISLAESLKESAKAVGWDGLKDVKGRRLLQELSWPIKHYHGENCYARWLVKKAENQKLDIVIVDDVRMYAEVEYFTEDCAKSGHETMLIRINRPNYVSQLTDEQKKDLSETQLDTYSRFAFVFENSDSLEELEESLRENVLPVVYKYMLEKVLGYKTVYVVTRKKHDTSYVDHKILNVFKNKADACHMLKKISDDRKRQIKKYDIDIDKEDCFSYSTTNDLVNITYQIEEVEMR